MYPEGLFQEEASKHLTKIEEEKTENTSTLQSAPIDFFDDKGQEETRDAIVTAPLSVVRTEYYQFDLSRQWEDSAVREVWMSKEACLDAYYLIEDAIKNAFQQKETIPEVGGFLVGVPHRREDGTFDVRIEKFVSVTPENNGEYEVTFGRDAFLQLDDVLSAHKEQKLTTIGWMHTHPGHGLFLSGKDVEVVNVFFKEPFHISMEVETKTRHLDTAFFTRKKNLKLNNKKSDENEWFSWEDVKFWLKTEADA